MRDAPYVPRQSLIIAALLIASSCTTGTGTGTATTTATAGGRTVIADGFIGPTQITNGPDGVVLVAQLAGEEAAATGQVLALDVDSGQRRVLLTGLDKPTGVLWQNGALWVMVRRRLVRAEWPGGDAAAGPVEVVLDDLPNNGRSEGTLTALDDGRFLYETTGRLVDGKVVDGSGTLWAFDPATRVSTPVATAVKNAYAHAVLPDGRIVTGDIGDNITNPPVDELDVVSLEGASAVLGWPTCPGDHDCAGVVRPLALFPPSATPTGVAVVGTDVYVALFVTGQLVRVSINGWTQGDGPVEPVVVADGLQGPHTVLARSNGTLWVSEHLTGRILQLQP